MTRDQSEDQIEKIAALFAAVLFEGLVQMGRSVPDPDRVTITANKFRDYLKVK